MYDIRGIEHTGHIEPQTGAVLQLSMRLWPYHMSQDAYGISGQISEYGAKVHYAGGIIPSRRKWKKTDYIVKKDINKWKVLDIRGGSFKIKTPVVTVEFQSENTITVSLSKTKYMMSLLKD